MPKKKFKILHKHNFKFCSYYSNIMPDLRIDLGTYIWLAQQWVCSNLAWFKFGWLKNGSAQIWLAQKWGCSNLCWLKFWPAQMSCSNVRCNLLTYPIKINFRNLHIVPIYLKCISQCLSYF